MPFKSEKQRRWMHANKPEMAKDWEKKLAYSDRKEKMKKETKVKELIKKMVREMMPEIQEGFAGGLPKGKRKAFDKTRRNQSEVLGYKLTGKSDIKTEIDDATIKEASVGDKFMKNIERYQDKIRKEREAYRKAKELQKKRNENINEMDFSKIKLPSQVNRFLERFVNSMKDANLNRMKRASILYKVIDAAGMTPQQLMADIQKIKQAMRK